MIKWKYFDFRSREFVTYIVVVSYVLPNNIPKVRCKHNLESSIIWSALFASGFLEFILGF